MERLYYRDSYLREFEANVIDRLTVNGKPAVVLDRTAFYPTSGGQPNDIGFMNGIPVLDVSEEDDRIIHLLEKEIAAQSVHAVIDWKRRFDHMQQHTGQHILSQAFIQVANADTIGFHMGEEVSTIDLNIGSLTDQVLWKAEDLANAIVQRNIPIRILFTDEEGLSKFNLRKDPEKKGEIRIVQIEGFDASACGGTHLLSTGEVGLIKIRKCEKIGSKMRVEVYCGMRALLDYRWKNSFILSCAGRFTTGEKDLDEAIERIEEENKKNKRELKQLKEKLIAYEAEELLGKAETVRGVAIVRALFEERDLQDVKLLSMLLKKREKVIALFGVKSDAAMLVFSRSDDLKIDIAAVLKKSLELVGGRGGGNPDAAQGGGSDLSMIGKALELAYSLVIQELS